MSSATQVFFRLEIAEAMRSRWLVFTAVVYGLVFAGFVWLGLRESRVMGFTGLSRVVLNVSNAIVLVVPLVALIATSQVIVKARHSGYFELMLSQPVRRSEWFVSAVASRLAVIVGPLLVLFAAALVGSALGAQPDAATGPIVARCLAVTVSLAWAFIGIGFWISASARTPERATVLALLAWVVASALHDFALIGALLRVRLPPEVVFVLAAANPVESARIAVLSGVDPELSVLGPVGFWLANTLGPRLMLAVGVAWPALLGTLGLLAAERRLVSSDLVN
ncbi:MAG: ABC transporter permease [Myxococcales bacterium]|jgi:ABC-2 type transport system permease protein|nr:ABC transporter permease [Myxococcales bacterium]MBL0195080.1 ABC transporter permease [Myxococcales bacterium]